MSAQAGLLAELDEAGQQLAEADAARDEAIRRVAAAVRLAHADGVSPTEMMRRTGVSRPTIYRMMRESRPATR